MPDDKPKVEADSGPAARPSPFDAPRVALPKGGGALRGISETFATDIATGSGSLKVPIHLSPGRAGSGPQLTLSYDSGTGNSSFGMGWRLGLPSITRRTDKGLPRYDDAPFLSETRRTDIFVLSGAEDLVPVLAEAADGGWRVPDELVRHGYAVQAYRPRTEGLFARIERWTRLDDGDTHWRSISRDNVLSVYGLDPSSRIADPDDATRVFSWLIARTYDDRGEAIVYDYVGEDDRCIDLDRPSERHRQRSANRYLRRIRWGNRVPQMLDPSRPSFRSCHLDAPDPDDAEWLFSAVFDYGEGRYEEEVPDEEGRVFAWAAAAPRHPWRARPDPFSNYRPGFELRTHRLCQRVLMFHHMPEELGVEDYLVASTGFCYRERPAGTLLARVAQCGHSRQQDGRYLTSALPPLDLGYTDSPLDARMPLNLVVREMEAAGLADLPGGVHGDTFRWLDLNGDGLSGVLTEQGGAWHFKANLGDGRLGAVATVPLRPTLAGMPSRTRHLMDVDGDGLVDLLDLSPSSPGYHGRDGRAGWLPFRTFRDVPVMDWNDPDLRFIDLTGDGIADVLITRDAAFDWRPSLLESGFGDARRVDVPTEEEVSGPRLLLAEPTETIFLADMTGDGLTDLVRVRNGEVCYWPNRGYGCFGAKVAMEHAPWFEMPNLFDSRRLHLADVDGTGNVDLVYLGANGARVFLNESGNGWSAARHITGWPANDSASRTDVIDLLGRGTACLVWSSQLPRDAGRQVRYIDLMEGRKPHLLCRIDANMGAVRRIEYASSTEFYLADKAAGTPWITRLPFPVHVVRRVETWDAVSRNRIVTRYSYHHGYYDGLEREFRGFGRVDQFDTEDIASLTPSLEETPATNWDAASSVPPVLTRTWFHTGVFIDGERVSRQLAHEYFKDITPDPDAGWLDRRTRIPLLADTTLPPGLSGFEAREACRALKGAILRREVYARDGAPVADTPYVVEEHNFTIVTVQPRGPNRYAAFFTHPRESITLHYERDACDPRISHDLTLLVDAYGNVLRSATLGYARRLPEHEEQARALATMTEQGFTNAVLLADAHRTPLAAAQTTFQLTAPAIASTLALGFAEIERLTADAWPIDYRDAPTLGRIEKRRVAAARTRYRANNLSRLLNEGELQALALPGEADTLALSDSLFDLFSEKAPLDDLRAIVTGPNGAYRDLFGDGAYWAPSGRVFYALSPEVPRQEELAIAVRSFFLPHCYRDPFGNDTTIEFDAPFNIAPVMTRDAVGNITRATLDYRVLAPHMLIDPNGNCSSARYDALGLLAGTAIAGKASGPIEGDSFERFTADLAPVAVTRFFDARDPRESAQEALGTATTRFLYDFARTPACVATVARETHVADLTPGQTSRLQLRFLYTDGFGRETQSRGQAEPGPLDLAKPEAGEASPRWVATGAKIYNNKGKAVRQFEPFFSATPQFGIERWGVSSILLYDPLERVVATLHPNHTFDKVVFDPWSETTYDVNDTVTSNPAEDSDVRGFVRRLPESDYLPIWYSQRIDGALGPQEQDAARRTAPHADTPGRTYFDVLGRGFLSVTDNGRGPDGEERLYSTRSVLDIKGAQLAVIDARGRVVLRDDYDLAGVKLRNQSMEAGTRWLLQDAATKPLRSWNSRNYVFRAEYDALHRPVRSFVRGGDAGQPEQYFPEEILFERTIYGDNTEIGLTEAERTARNLRTKVFKHFDSAGILETDRYDFKGNSRSSARRLARYAQAPPDWSTFVALEVERFQTASEYDALNRAIAVTAPDNSIYRPTFNDASLLERVEVNLRGGAVQGERLWTRFVDFINYDAKGRRTAIAYANGTHTAYSYDPLTFRLTRMRTTRERRVDAIAVRIFHDASLVQDLHYTYDPIGNIIRIDDAALRTVFHGARRIAAASDFDYDAMYRLLSATGREHRAQSALSFAPPGGNYRDFPFVGAAHPHDLDALRCYRERYEYDSVGNVLRMSHRAEGANWERGYDYEEPSLLQPDQASNRLSRTTTGHEASTLVERYRHDVHGNITRMPHMPLMAWDFRDQFSASSRQVAAHGIQELTYYVYDGAGQRARKLTLRPDGRLRRERLYLGGFEVFREYDPTGELRTQRQTLHVMDDVRRIALVETLTVRNGHDASAAPGAAKRFQLANHLGSASLELDGDGGLISYEEYSPYGSTTYQARQSVAEVSLKRYRYTGKERDEESGFTYHGARYYAPWLGRWTACDPAGITDGINVFTYARNNPVILHDPSGRQSQPGGGVFLPHGFTGKETVQQLHQFARSQGWDFRGTPRWTGTSWQASGGYRISSKPETKGGAAPTPQAGSDNSAPGGQTAPTPKAPTALDKAAKVAGYANLQFDDEKGGVSGGIPGGHGPAENASEALQAAYIALAAFDVVSLGKALFSLAAAAVSGIGRFVAARLAARAAAKEAAELAAKEAAALAAKEAVELAAKEAAAKEAAALAAKEAAAKSAGATFTESQLQHAFKHAKDFGVVGNQSKKTLAEFSAAIEKHIADSGTRVIEGEFRGIKNVTIFVNPGTGLAVIRDASGKFLSGWKLSAQQLHYALTIGKLGGG
jgi:RHS repeat-associated protein